MHLRVLIIALAFAWLAGALARGDPRPAAWRAGELTAEADLIVVVEGPILGRPYPLVPAPDSFARKGSSRVLQFAVVEPLFGDLNIGDEFAVINPAGLFEHVSMVILPGQSLLLLRELNEDESRHLRESMPRWARALPDRLWAFVETDYEWMSAVQLITYRGEEIDHRPRGRMVQELERLAGVEPTKDAIVAYIRGLVELRDAVLANEPTPAAETLDVFQQDVVRVAAEERERREQPPPADE